MDSTIIAAFITGAVSILGALIVIFIFQVFFSRKPPESKLNKLVIPIWAVVVIVILGGVIGGLVGYFLIVPTALPCPFFAPTSVTITSPASGSKVPQSITVQGTACHIPNDAKLWVLVMPDNVTAYYPQPDPITVSSDGKWSTTAFIGPTSANVVRGFVLYPALANREGNAAIYTYFKTAPNYQPLNPLPEGIQLMSQVHVVRI
jgi:hypothetical protein